jgi:hypothetical protein
LGKTPEFHGVSPELMFFHPIFPIHAQNLPLLQVCKPNFPKSTPKMRIQLFEWFTSSNSVVIDMVEKDVFKR